MNEFVSSERYHAYMKHTGRRPKLSLLVPTLAEPENYRLLQLFLWSVGYTANVPVEVCLSVYPRDARLPGWLRTETDPWKTDVPVVVGERDHPGVGHGNNQAFDMSSGEWVAVMNDDVVLLPGWDDFEARMAPDRVAVWELLEPGRVQTSYPPPVDAGFGPADFDFAKVRDAAALRNRPHSSPGGFFGFSLCHRDVYGAVRFAEDLESYSAHDIDFYRRLYLRFPDLLFGRLNLCVYHFQRSTIDRHPELHTGGERTQELFRAKHGMSTSDAYRLVEDRTARLVEEDPSRWPSPC